MSHLEHDRLVFLALGEDEADPVETGHLGNCGACRHEVATLRQVAGLAAQTRDLRDLPPAPEHIWQGIVAEVAAAQALPSLNGARSRTASADPASAVDPASADRASAAGPTDRSRAAGMTTTGTRSRTAHGRLSRWAVTAATAMAAAAAGVVGTLAVVRPDAEPPPAAPTVVAAADLAAYGDTPPAAAGDARVFADGRLHLHVANLPTVDGYYEVWLIDPDTMKMFSVGVLGGGSDVLLPLPVNVDLDRYSVVDVSAEHYDNNTAHSGDSLLRGELAA